MRKQEISWLRSGARAHNDNFHTQVSSLIGQHFGKKMACCPQQELRIMHSEVSQPTRWCPQSLRKCADVKSTGTYCKLMSSAQEHLSVICAKFLQLQVAQIRAWKLCRKPFQGLLLGNRGTENLRNVSQWSSGRGLTSDTSFEPVSESDPRKF